MEEDLIKEIEIRNIIKAGKKSQRHKKSNKSKLRLLKEKQVYGNIRGTGKNVKEEILVIRLSKLYNNMCEKFCISDCRIKDINEFIDCRSFYILNDEVVKYETFL